MTKTVTGAREGVYITIPTQRTTQEYVGIDGELAKCVQRFMSPPSVRYLIANKTQTGTTIYQQVL